MPPVIVHKHESYKYTPKQRRINEIRFGNGISNPYDGRSLFLPKKQYYSQGEGLGDIMNFVSENKDLIQNIAGAVGSVVDTVGKVGTTTVDIIRKIKELKQQGISQKALEDVLRAKPKNEENQKDGGILPLIGLSAVAASKKLQEEKKGSGFFLLDK
jgi:hypothetical protein